MSRFVAPFRQFFEKATDAPYEYGEAAALMTLSSICLGRRELDYGSGIKPNLFMMLVGDSSVARKSTSVALSKKFLAEVDEARIGPRDYTIEGLLKWMSEKDPTTAKTKNKVVLFAEEFGADLARMEAYAATMATDFCALYDGESFEKARAAAAIVRVNKPRVNLFAAAAYPMLQRFVRPRDWMNGFFMRFMFVAPLQMRPPFTIQPSFPAPEYSLAVNALKALHSDVDHTVSTHRLLKLDYQAEQLFTQYMAHFGAVLKSLAPVEQTYHARFGVNLLKLALLYQTDMDPFTHVTALAVQQAINFAMPVCWPSFKEAYKQSAMGEFDTLFASVYATLQETGPILRADLARKYWGNILLDKVVSYLKSHGIASSIKTAGGEKIALTETWQAMYQQAAVTAAQAVGLAPAQHYQLQQHQQPVYGPDDDQQHDDQQH